MDLVKELEKKTKNIMKDDKAKEQVGDVIENALKEAKKHIKDKDKQKTIDTIIKGVDKATTKKKK